MHITSKQIELKNPDWLGFVANSKPDQTGLFLLNLSKSYVRTNILCHCYNTIFKF